MKNIADIYSIYWISVYFLTTVVAIYGYRKISRQEGGFASRAGLRYFAVVAGIFAAAWLLWKGENFLFGGLTVERFESRDVPKMLETIRRLLEAGLALIFMAAVGAAFRSRFINAVKYLPFALGTLALCTGIFIADTERVDSMTKAAEFPAGETRTYLENYLTANNYPSRLFLVESREANAWVTGDDRNLDVYFTSAAVERLPKEQMIGILAHELGHKFEPGMASDILKILPIFTGLIIAAALGLAAVFAVITPLGKWFGFILSTEKNANNRAGLKRLMAEIPNRFAHSVMLLVILSLPAVILINSLKRSEERHADAVADRLLSEANLPVEYRMEGLRAIHTANSGSENDSGWLYHTIFDTHPPTAERIAFRSTVGE